MSTAGRPDAKPRRAPHAAAADTALATHDGMLAAADAALFRAKEGLVHSAGAT